MILVLTKKLLLKSLLLERGRPGDDFKVVARIDGVGRTVDTDVVVTVGGEVTGFDIDAVGISASGGIRPIVVGEGGGLNDRGVEPEDASGRRGELVFVKDDGEGGDGTVVAIEDPLVGGDSAFEGLARANGLNGEFTVGTAAGSRADAEGGVGGGARAAVGSAGGGAGGGLRGRGGGGGGNEALDGSGDAVLAIRETKDTNLPVGIEGVLNDETSLGGVGDIAIEEGEASGVDIALDIDVTILASGVADGDDERRGGIRGRRVEVPLGLFDETGNSFTSGGARSQVTGHLAAIRVAEGGFTSTHAVVGAATVRGTGAGVGAGGGTRRHHHLPSKHRRRVTIKANIIRGTRLRLRHVNGETLTRRGISVIKRRKGRHRTLLNVQIHITCLTFNTNL